MLAQGVDDVGLSVDDVGGRELDHQVARALQLVATMCISLPLTIGRRAPAVRYLDDRCCCRGTGSRHGRWSGHLTGGSPDTAAGEDQRAERGEGTSAPETTRPRLSSKIARSRTLPATPCRCRSSDDPRADRRQRGELASDGLVEDVLHLLRAGRRSGEIDDDTSGARDSGAIVRQQVATRPVHRRVHDEREVDVPARSRHDELAARPPRRRRVATMPLRSVRTVRRRHRAHEGRHGPGAASRRESHGAATRRGPRWSTGRHRHVEAIAATTSPRRRRGDPPTSRCRVASSSS